MKKKPSVPRYIKIKKDKYKPTRLYACYSAIIQRCYNKSNHAYKWYGGRGIALCERWLGRDGYANFAEDMGDVPEGLSIDKIDNNSNYSPDNCRWATKSEQSINRRDPKNNSSGFLGVSYVKANKNWKSSIQINNQSIWLGSYPTAIEASVAREYFKVIVNAISYKILLVSPDNASQDYSLQ